MKEAFDWCQFDLLISKILYMYNSDFNVLCWSVLIVVVSLCLCCFISFLSLNQGSFAGHGRASSSSNWPKWKPPRLPRGSRRWWIKWRRWDSCGSRHKKHPMESHGIPICWGLSKDTATGCYRHMRHGRHCRHGTNADGFTLALWEVLHQEAGTADGRLLGNADFARCQQQILDSWPNLKCNMKTSGNLGLPQEVSGGVRLHETVCGCMRFFPIFPSDEIGNVILVGWKLNSDASQVLNGHSTKKTEEPSCNLLQTHPLWRNDEVAFFRHMVVFFWMNCLISSMSNKESWEKDNPTALLQDAACQNCRLSCSEVHVSTCHIPRVCRVGCVEVPFCMRIWPLNWLVTGKNIQEPYKVFAGGLMHSLNVFSIVLFQPAIFV